MATVTFIKYQKQSASALRGVAQYVSQDEKTLDENGSQLISGQNCTPPLVSQEFQATRDMYHKESPVWFYHYVQSFSPDEVIIGEQAQQLTKEFAAKAWPDSEVLIATHLDAEHIHSHFIVNAVCWESGKMLRQGPNTLRSLRQLSDELCREHGFSVLPQQKKKQSQGMGAREYRSAAKGESWKFRLMNTIDQCMQFAASKEEFISLMESEGYQVRWTASRKNITYTTPQGMKCRDDRLHELKYTKEVMEREFRVRAEIIYRGMETAESAQQGISLADGAAARGGLGRTAGSAGRSGGQRCGTGGPVTGVVPAGGAAPHPGADGGPGVGCGPNAGGVETGWEEERALYLAAQSPGRAVGLDLAGPDPAGDHGWHGGLADDLVRLCRTLEGGQVAVPVRDSTTTHQHTDRKLRQKERQKKNRPRSQSG
ncbi:relaxase/mobilization nuclease domain-containing protein [Oscillibacter valericigenes]|uniref:Relaxase/mobilization nuclease domain-containing protein n=1 Tax=Oscillibacter valericigenes TaxID=351091 RepID=A0ABS2FUY6_9FIRM|nr:relaxase/mobilization nuclease domain-containing protein [Oscillibacter valericigenes]MBM6851467.1 relaxase/mobilization nuclease domain-containing protein [Oscillibacter valericigenes]